MVFPMLRSPSLYCCLRDGFLFRTNQMCSSATQDHSKRPFAYIPVFLFKVCPGLFHRFLLVGSLDLDSREALLEVCTRSFRYHGRYSCSRRHFLQIEFPVGTDLRGLGGHLQE